MKKLITIIALLYALMPARAQYESFFGRESWEYATGYHPVMKSRNYNPEILGCMTNTYHFTRTDTTTISGKMYYNNDALGHPTYLVNQVKLREDTLNGRLYSLCDGTEYLICDMSLETGDTFSLCIPTWWNNVDTVQLVADSVTYINSKKVIHLSALSSTGEWWLSSIVDFEGDFNISLRFMEGIGPMYGIVPPYQIGEILFCLTKDDSLFYMTHPDVGCWQITYDVPDYPEPLLNLYPNPVSQKLSIRFEEPGEVQGDVYIRDITGRICLHAKVNSAVTNLNVSRLPQGVYTLTFIGIDRKITKKFVVK